MTMLNQAAVEALCSATYMENYLDTMETLPDDMQRVVTQMRELDIQCKDVLQDLEVNKEMYMRESEGPLKKKAFMALQRALIKCQEIGDEKLCLMTQIIEHIDNRARQLDQDRENLDPTSGKDADKEDVHVPVHVAKPPKQTTNHHAQHTNTPQTPQEDKPEKTAVKRQRRQKTTVEPVIKEEEKREDKEKVPKKKKKRKAKKEKETTPASPLDPPIDPDEPTYCLCDQVSYGEMIGCDNDACVIEWFHFNCVGLINKPKGKWFCPNCRGETSKIMRKFDK